MAVAEKGVVAAGHPLTAEAGAEVLRKGGNAVDAAVGAMLTSFVAEPLLTRPGGGARGRRCSTSSWRPPRERETEAQPSSKRWTCPSATPCRCSTSDLPPA